jgi:phosphoglycolate phosphatase
MPRYALAIFDFDGTLADSFPWFCSVLNQTARQFNFREVAPGEIEDLRSRPTREIIARLGVPRWRLPAIAMHMRTLSASSADAIPLFPGVATMLAALTAQGVAIGVVSSNAEATVRRALGPAAQHVGRFDCGVSLWGKSAKFKAMVRSLGVDAERTIAIGDEIRDIEAAREAGIAASVVIFGYNTAASLRDKYPDLVFDDYTELVTELTG